MATVVQALKWFSGRPRLSQSELNLLYRAGAEVSRRRRLAAHICLVLATMLTYVALFVVVDSLGVPALVRPSNWETLQVVVAGLSIALLCCALLFAAAYVAIAAWVLTVRYSRFLPDQAVEGILRGWWKFSWSPQRSL